MKNNKIYKIIVGTSGVIFLGALWSGLLGRISETIIPYINISRS